jgi:hypothetical protein
MATSNIPYLGDLISTSVASYGDLSGANFDQAKLSLALSKSGSNANFTQKQADVFSKRYTLLDQLPNVPYNGFSASVFEDNTNSGKHVIALRGTEVPVFPQQTWLDLIMFLPQPHSAKSF